MTQTISHDNNEDYVFIYFIDEINKLIGWDVFYSKEEAQNYIENLKIILKISAYEGRMPVLEGYEQGYITNYGEIEKLNIVEDGIEF